MERRKFRSRFKVKVVLDSLTERYTVAELSHKHKVHASQISQWKNHFMSHVEQVFEKEHTRDKADEIDLTIMLKTIGELKLENDFLKKSLGVKP